MSGFDFGVVSRVNGIFLGAVLLFLCANVVEAKRSGKIPAWVEGTRKGASEYDRFSGENSAMVLLSDHVHEYDSRGVQSSTVRRVIHFDSKEERSYGQASIYLSSSKTKLVSFSAWLVYPSGKVESFGKRDLVKVAANMDQLYSESSYMILDRSASIRSDTIFAYEYEVVVDSSILEDYHFFQESIPVIRSRYELEIPKDWSVNAVPLNCEKLTHEGDGSKFVWEMSNLDPVKDEPSRPPLFAISAMLGISVYPESEDARRNKLEVFDSWSTVARYLQHSQVEQMSATSEMSEKVEALVAGKATDWERIEAICEYAQSVNYVAVSMNLAKGGGYVPRPASFVFEKHYGDCKDMTVLARSMLKVAGYNAYPVTARIGNEEYVNDIWPSPVQFNHCILAVDAPASVDKPAIVEHPQYGRLLFFDPTAKFTRVGELPSSLQDTSVLVGSDWSTQLVRLPLNAPSENLTERDISLTLSLDGTITGRIVEKSIGVGADYMRALSRKLSGTELEERLQAWIAMGTREAKVSNIKITEHAEENLIILELDFEAPYYARRLGDSKLIIRPIFLARREWVPPTKEERTTDFQFGPWSLEETIRVEFPENYAVESIRDSFSEETDFYSYSLKAEYSGNTLSIRRDRTSRNARVSKDEYSRIVSFFENMTRMESAPVVVGRSDG